MKRILVLALYFSVAICNGQTYSSVISDEEILSFIKWETSMTAKSKKEAGITLYHRLDYFDSTNFISRPQPDIWTFDCNLFDTIHHSGLDTALSGSDKEFMFRQFIGIKDSVWRHEFSNVTFVESYERDPNDPYDYPSSIYSYSLPIFSQDRKFAIISKSYFCGSLCGEGGFYIYQRVDKDKWKFVKVICYWIS